MGEEMEGRRRRLLPCWTLHFVREGLAQTVSKNAVTHPEQGVAPERTASTWHTHMCQTSLSNHCIFVFGFRIPSTTLQPVTTNQLRLA